MSPPGFSRSPCQGVERLGRSQHRGRSAWRPPRRLHALGRRCWANSVAGGNGPRFPLKVTAKAFARSTRSGGREQQLGASLPPLPRGVLPFPPFLTARKRFPLPLPLTSPPRAWLLSRFFLARKSPWGSLPSLPAPGMRKEEETGGPGAVPALGGLRGSFLPASPGSGKWQA